MKKKNSETNDYDYSAFAGAGHNSSVNELFEVAALAAKTYAAHEKVEEKEGELKAAKEIYQDLSERKLPAKMEEVGLTEYTTTDGVSVEVSEKVRASLKEENRPKGYKWLEDNNFGGLIKSEIVIIFPRQQLEKANELLEELRGRGFVANLERRVEPSTLTAFVKEQLALGTDIPLDVFGVFRQRVATVEKDE